MVPRDNLSLHLQVKQIGSRPIRLVYTSDGFRLGEDAEALSTRRSRVPTLKGFLRRNCIKGHKSEQMFQYSEGLTYSTEEGRWASLADSQCAVQSCMTDWNTAGAATDQPTFPRWEMLHLLDAAVQSTETPFGGGEEGGNFIVDPAENPQTERNSIEKGADALLSRAEALIYMWVSIPAAGKPLIVHPTYCCLCGSTNMMFRSFTVNQVASPMQHFVKYCCPPVDLPEFGKQVPMASPRGSL